MGWMVNMNLKDMVLLKVVTQLWKHVSTSYDFRENVQMSDEKYHLLEDICLENIEKLPLPNILQVKIKKLIKPIGIEIVKFNRNHIGRIPGNDCVQQNPVNLFWTVKGTVDTKRTFKALIDDESLDLSFRYRLACQCCLINDVSFLWSQMPEELKFDFAISSQELHVIKMWSIIKMVLQGSIFRFSISHSFCEYGISLSVKDCNKDAVEFFWNELSEEERSIVLPKLLRELRIKHHTDLFKKQGNSIQYVYEYTEVLLFLLSQADERSLGDIIYGSSDVLLNILWNWRCQEDFLEILDCFMLYVGSLEYDSILRNVVGKICFGFQDYDYGLLLKSLLKQESTFQKQCDKPIFPSSFDIFYYFRRDSEAVSLIASYYKRELKKNVLFSQDIFKNLSDDEEWEFLTFVLDECILKSKQEIFRSVCKVPFRRINYENIKSEVGRLDCDDFIRALTREKDKYSYLSRA